LLAISLRRKSPAAGHTPKLLGGRRGSGAISLAHQLKKILLTTKIVNDVVGPMFEVEIIDDLASAAGASGIDYFGTG
jgi:hypothetical protein